MVEVYAGRVRVAAGVGGEEPRDESEGRGEPGVGAQHPLEPGARRPGGAGWVRRGVPVEAHRREALAQQRQVPDPQALFVRHDQAAAVRGERRLLWVCLRPVLVFEPGEFAAGRDVHEPGRAGRRQEQHPATVLGEAHGLGRPESSPGLPRADAVEPGLDLGRGERRPGPAQRRRGGRPG